MALFCVHATPSDAVRFVDVAQEAGIDFRHESGRTGALRLPEIIGAGVAIFDFDGDGRMDVYLVQGGPLPGAPLARGGPSRSAPLARGSPSRSAPLARGSPSRSAPLARGSPSRSPTLKALADERPTDRLYRNVGGPGELRFEDVTAQASLKPGDYGMGVATGDIDNDGDTDLFRTALGRNRLLINDRGRFLDATDAAGGDEWSISASLTDIDGDGLLDLYVANYLAYDMASPACEADGRPRYCPPSHYPAAPDRLYRNLGGGRFEDAFRRTSAMKGGATPGVVARAAMGVAAADFDRDGRADFLVANDGSANGLWMNRGGSFDDVAFEAGVAVNADGDAEAGMGVVVADVDADGDSDAFLTHDVTESNTLYVNEGLAEPRFLDQSVRSGVAAGSLPFTGFGTGAFDFDNDGDLDLFVANGPIANFRLGGLAPASRHNVLWANTGDGRFQRASRIADDDTSRGAAFGDLDNDGDIDVVVANNHGPARLYRNDGATGNWLGIAVRGLEGQRNAIGAEVWRLSAPELRRIHTDGSYASASDPRIVFGLGQDDQPQHVRVRWPDGSEHTFGPLAINRYHILTLPLQKGTPRRTD